MGGEATSLTPHESSQWDHARPMRFRVCAWPARAGWGTRQAFRRVRSHPNPGKLLDCKGFVVRALLHREPFCSSPTLLPSPDQPQGGTDAVWTPCTFLDCITNTHKGKRQAGHQRSLSFKLWVLLAGFIVILIYRTASGMVIHTL